MNPTKQQLILYVLEYQLIASVQASNRAFNGPASCAQLSRVHFERLGVEKRASHPVAQSLE